MRILNVTAQKPDSTGSGTYLAETVRCQVEDGHETAVVCGVGKDDTIDLPSETHVVPVRFDTPELPFHVAGMSDVMPYPATRYRDMTPAMVERFKAAFAKALLRADAEFEPDVVVCHHLYLVTALARTVLPHRRMAAISHSTDLRQLSKHGLERDFIIDGICRLDAVLALHEAQRAEIAEVFGIPAERIAVVGVGYNDRVFNRGTDAGETGGDGLRSPSDDPGRTGRILYVGKICSKKGVPSLIRAYGSLPEDVGPTELVLAGGYNDASEYDAIVDLAARCPRPVRFAGKLAPRDLADAYRASDVFALASFFEGLPLVAVEALACGCKAVLTDLPGVRPWLEGNVPDAPVRYVAMPRMLDIDTPDPADLPAFERRLAAALCDALAMPRRACDASRATWRNVSRRIVTAALGG